MSELSNFLHDSEKSKYALEWKTTKMKKSKTEARSFTDGNRQNKMKLPFLLLLTMRMQLTAWIVSTVELFETHCFYLCVLIRNRIFSFGGFWVYWGVSETLHLKVFRTIKRLIHATKIIKSKKARQKNLKLLTWTLKRDIKPVPVEKDEL